MSNAMAQLARVRTGQRTWAALQTQVQAIADNAGELLSHSTKAWASITFSGTRHEVELMFRGVDEVAAGERLIEALPEHEFSIPGQLVADASVNETYQWFDGDVPRLRIVAVLLLLEED